MNDGLEGILKEIRNYKLQDINEGYNWLTAKLNEVIVILEKRRDPNNSIRHIVHIIWSLNQLKIQDNEENKRKAFGNQQYGALIPFTGLGAEYYPDLKLG